MAATKERKFFFEFVVWFPLQDHIIMMMTKMMNTGERMHDACK